MSYFVSGLFVGTIFGIFGYFIMTKVPFFLKKLNWTKDKDTLELIISVILVIFILVMLAIL